MVLEDTTGTALIDVPSCMHNVGFKLKQLCRGDNAIDDQLSSYAGADTKVRLSSSQDQELPESNHCSACIHNCSSIIASTSGTDAKTLQVSACCLMVSNAGAC